MIVKYDSAETTLNNVISISNITDRLNSDTQITIQVAHNQADDDSADDLYNTWNSKQGSIIVVKDDADSNYFFRGFVGSVNFTPKIMTLICISDLGRLNFDSQDKNYIKASGTITSVDSETTLTLEDINGAAITTTEFANGQEEYGIMVTDTAQSSTTTWTTYAETNDGFSDADTGVIANCSAKDGTLFVKNHTLSTGQDLIIVSTDIAVSGTGVGNSNGVNKVEIFVKMSVNLESNGNFGSLRGWWQVKNQSSGGYISPPVEYAVTGYNNGNDYTIDSVWTVDESALINVLLYDGGVNFEKVDLRFKIEKYEHPTVAWTPQLKIDYVKVVLYWDSNAFSPISEKITSIPGASQITCSGATFSSDQVAANDSFAIGHSTRQVANETLGKYTNLNLVVDSNFNRYIARYYKGLADISIIRDICALEQAYYFQDNTVNSLLSVIYLQRDTSFTDCDFDTNSPLTSADFGDDFEITRDYNQYKGVKVYGNNVSALAYDTTAANTSEKYWLVSDEKIQTQSDADYVANALLTRLKSLRPSIVITLYGTGYESITPGRICYATFERPTIAKTGYEVRRVDRTQEFNGVQGTLKTVVYLGLGNTPDDEHIANIINDMVVREQELRSNRLVQAAGGGTISHNSLTNVSTSQHHVKYTDAEAAAKIASDNLYIRKDGTVTFTGNQDMGGYTLSNSNQLSTSKLVVDTNFQIDGTTIATLASNFDLNINCHGTGGVVINSSTRVIGVIDDDTMATASNEKLSTSESIKAYVDSFFTRIYAYDYFVQDSNAIRDTVAGISNGYENGGTYLYGNKTADTSAVYWRFNIPPWMSAGLTFTLHIEFWGGATNTYNTYCQISSTVVGDDLDSLAWNILDQRTAAAATTDLATVSTKVIQEQTVGSLTGIVANDSVLVQFVNVDTEGGSSANYVVIRRCWFTWA